MDHGFSQSDVERIRKCKFSPQERKVIRLNARGFTSKEIAMELAIKEGTVAKYKDRIIGKSGMKGSTVSRKQIWVFIATARGDINLLGNADKNFSAGREGD